MEPSPPKHLIFVHGRSTKPSRKEKERLVRAALLRGVERNDRAAAEKIRSGKVKFTLAYFGDVNNRLLRRSGTDAWKWMAKKDPDHGNALCEDGAYYDDALAKALARPTEAFTRTDYREWLGKVKDFRAIDEIASVASGVANFLGLSDELVRRTSPDMAAYLTRRTVGSEIRTRVQEPLREALSQGHDVCLLAHSMGCLVAYDVLWKFSRLSEYRRLRGKEVSLWLTLGNPLGDPGVRSNLYDAHEPEESRFPENIIDTWINMSAHDDFICHDSDIADDFRDMKRRGYVRRILDRPKIYTFWEGSGGANPHKLYAYLNHPAVGAEIARWIHA
ncbi:hypothetical protein Poly30_53880 [Planctomycetes bacterium Poly30]|uniref:Alpha/beta hydrolase family protein n=1 Tax=Saltatorellus ferox TaxID=2528018 RepID=A0A518F0F8_9BACT|nr:hypothetical protein Poly30_53880 [Planctomycetes bacterium Poly30]